MNFNYDVCFIGGLFSDRSGQQVKQEAKGNIQYAANNLQWGFVDGLDANCDAPPKLINAVYNGAYPINCRKLFIRSHIFSHIPGAEDVDVGFINAPLYKHISKYLHMRSPIRSWVRRRDGRAKIAVGYAMSYEITKALTYIKKLDKDIITCLIVPDLPEYMTMKRSNALYEGIRTAGRNGLYERAEKMDYIVQLSDKVSERLRGRIDNITIEGIADSRIIHPVSNVETPNGIRSILYTGGLNEAYGVTELIRAFMQIKDDSLRLIVCGSGDASAWIRDCAKEDARIVHRGLVSRMEAVELQRRAYFLVNPRPDTDEFVKYSFPSKTLEYMSSGRPVLMNRLPGVPSAYYQYVYTIEGDMYSALTTLLYTCTPEELAQKGADAAKFIAGEKTATMQVRKLMERIAAL